MPNLNDFEKKRQENIERNKQLLRDLELEALNASIYQESLENKIKIKNVPNNRKRKVSTRVKKEAIVPTRRSKRIAGVKLENDEDYLKSVEEEARSRKIKEELERIQNTRLVGDVKLIDVLKNDIKEEGDEEDSKASVKLLAKLQDLGKSVSAGDFYDMMVEKSNANNGEHGENNLSDIREEFSNIHLDSKFNPLDIKLTEGRITSIAFHPSTTTQLVIAGDKIGTVGLWSINSDKEDDDGEPIPDVTQFRYHKRNVAQFLFDIKSPEKLYTASYEGSIRRTDLNVLKNEEVFGFDSKYHIGISDVRQPNGDPNLLYFTTLNGQFAKLDLRVHNTPENIDFYRLHDKKIGTFCINPKFGQHHQIATASLDRTFKIWDLRNVSETTELISSLGYEGQISPHCYGFYGSRLSISSVDWNLNNRIVCNGYDDTINIFDVNEANNWDQDYYIPVSKKLKHENENQVFGELKPLQKIKHNCQTGRWVSILKSKWQNFPRDNINKFVIANMNRYFDVYNEEGQQIGHLGSELMSAVPAVATFHPTENWIVGGSASGKIYYFH